MGKVKNLFLSGGVLSLLLVTFIIPTTMSAESVKVKANFIKISAQKYRRASAESATLASIGSKRTPVGKVPRFERVFDWKNGKLRLKQVTTVTIASSQANRLNARAAVLTSNGSANAEVAVSSGVNADYVLTKFEIYDKTDVPTALNKSKNTLKQIKDIKNARIISSVWVLVKGSESQMSTFDGSVALAKKGANGKLTIARSSEVSFSFSPNTVIAYTIDKFKWNKKGLKRKSIKKIQTDQVWR